MFSLENFRDRPLTWLVPLTVVIHVSVILLGFDLKGIK